jgi:16S rRNA (guanine1516-N2)-methyltransferase
VPGEQTDVCRVTPAFGVACADGYGDACARVAHALGIAVLAEQVEPEQIHLFLDDTGWCLRRGKSDVRVDFESGASTYRRLHGGGRGELIARAIGVRSGNRLPSVMDATAGLGRDAFVLATLGCSVMLFERSPVVHLLLSDGLRRAEISSDGVVREVAVRLSLSNTDAVHFMQSNPVGAMPDVIYLDPMFPDRRKSAAVKKEMALFQSLLHDEGEDADSLLEMALTLDVYRVVVKRPRHAPVLGMRKPTHSLEGSSTRFDVYALKSLAAKA